ncbi:hypothetical protein QWY31_16360 [Cytophagales bacterium LB-30]|uniref:Lipoprotein n=1 Tax=Shiella aurantiaca TaxID=3058365 RepID=A0ABT8F9G7_9BACT|nr:hypothetical protein [Shiella aurantiaca]MDN4167085.1 hypothetical protein [Shiella aurantiaca]
MRSIISKGTAYFLLFLFSCQPGALSPAEWDTYFALPENGYYQEQKMGDIKVAVAFRPSESLALQEMGGAIQKGSEWDSLLQKYSPYYYFVLHLSENDRELLYSPRNYPKYGELLQALSFRIHEFVKAKGSNGEEIPLVDYYFQPTYGMSSSNDILLVFEKQAARHSDDLTLILKDFGAGTGDHSFVFDVPHLENLPELSFTQ